MPPACLSSFHTWPLPILLVTFHLSPPNPKPSLPSHGSQRLFYRRSLGIILPQTPVLHVRPRPVEFVHVLIPLACVWRHPTQCPAQSRLSFLEQIKACRPYLHFLSVEYCNFAGDGAENGLHSFIVLLQLLGNSF